jgi:hypothetical protein
MGLHLKSVHAALHPSAEPIASPVADLPTGRDDWRRSAVRQRDHFEATHSALSDTAAGCSTCPPLIDRLSFCCTEYSLYSPACTPCVASLLSPSRRSGNEVLAGTVTDNMCGVQRTKLQPVPSLPKARHPVHPNSVPQYL